jgi:hypothetical protein
MPTLPVLAPAPVRLRSGDLFAWQRSAARLTLAAINRAFFQSNAFVSAAFSLRCGFGQPPLGFELRDAVRVPAAFKICR